MTQMKFNNFKGFNDEFSRMSSKVGQYTEFSQLSGEKKKRFKNIPCYDHTRVKCGHTYLHANFIPGFMTEKDYIIMMPPDQDEIAAFWKMVMENNVQHVVMVGP